MVMYRHALSSIATIAENLYGNAWEGVRDEGRVSKISYHTHNISLDRSFSEITQNRKVPCQHFTSTSCKSDLRQLIPRQACFIAKSTTLHSPPHPLLYLVLQRRRIHKIDLLHVLWVPLAARLAGAFDRVADGTDFGVCEGDVQCAHVFVKVFDFFGSASCESGRGG